MLNVSLRNAVYIESKAGYEAGAVKGVRDVA